MIKSPTSLVGAAFIAVIASPAFAQSHAGGKGKAPDPSEMVCEKITMLGSRVATKRVCMTRAQWADRRRTDRQEIERAQVSACAVTRSGGGKNNCY